MKLSKETMYENCQVLNLVQALVGSISRNFRRIYLSTVGEKVNLLFILETDNEEDREEITDIIAEFEALQTKAVDIDYEIIINPKGVMRYPDEYRIVFGRKEF